MHKDHLARFLGLGQARIEQCLSIRVLRLVVGEELEHERWIVARSHAHRLARSRLLFQTAGLLIGDRLTGKIGARVGCGIENGQEGESELVDLSAIGLGELDVLARRLSGIDEDDFVLVLQRPGDVAVGLEEFVEPDAPGAPVSTPLHENTLAFLRGTLDRGGDLLLRISSLVVDGLLGGLGG